MSGLGVMMAGGKAARGAADTGRREDDYYPTPAEPVLAFLDVEAAHLRAALGEGGAVWEPACGDGSLARVLASAGFDVVGTDLRHRGFGAGGVDFLALGPGQARARAIVTNPPFVHAAAFIRQARRMKASYLALLLKATYWHAATRLPLWSDWPPAAIYPLAWRVNFTGGSGSTMDVAWCVWRAGSTTTLYRPLARPAGADGLFTGDR